MNSLRLYTYFRSSTSYRVRIALNLKGLAYEAIPVHLLRDGGQQHSAAHAARNPAELVPVLQEGTFTLGRAAPAARAATRHQCAARAHPGTGAGGGLRHSSAR